MQDPAQFTTVMERYADTVLRVCLVYLHQRADAEDAFQETFIRYARCDAEFSSEEHLKAWLIRVAANVCKDVLKSAARRVESLAAPDGISVDADRQRQAYLVGEASDFSDPAEVVGMDAAGPPGGTAGPPDVTAALAQLDERYRLPLFLKYYEGNTADQIAELLDMPVNTVYTNIARGKAKLKEVLEHGDR